MKNLSMTFYKPAEDSLYGWEHHSFPMANAHMGVNLFGGVPTERMQITENSLFNAPSRYLQNHYSAGLMNFAEVYLDFEHKFEDVENYVRTLSLNTATANIDYDCDGVHYSRESFGSYPDNIWVNKLTASKKGALSFTLRVVSPDNCDFLVDENDGLGRHGTVSASGDTVTQSGHADAYGIDFEGLYKIVTDGKLSDDGEKIFVSDASEAVLYMVVGTNYKLDEEVFMREPNKDKLKGFPHPHERLEKALSDAVKKGYDEIKKTHLADYTALFDRLELDLGGTDEGLDNDTLLKDYANGIKNPRIEELCYQMGRYVLIVSSRSGCLPPNLQAIWNCYAIPPWQGFYAYNINVQMNYWSVFSANLAECFKSFEEFNRARMKSGKKIAREFTQKTFPSKAPLSDGDYGIALRSGSPYFIGGFGGHTGPGSIGFTNQLYWDYYMFTMDREILKNEVYPLIKGATKFYSNFVEKQPDGTYLCRESASPEQCEGWAENGKYHRTVGCAFDQQFIYDNNRAFLLASEILGDDPIVDKELVKTVKEQIDHYDPVQVGYSGQIKEYREENWYSDIGQPFHRHLSQLMAAAPGTQINSNTPAWLDAVVCSLRGRGMSFVGWGLMHRLSLWARAQNEAMCEHVLDKLISENVFPNLWTGHNPDECFQIDAALGLTAGINEALLQSHEGYLNLLPALPRRWKNGSIKGIKARGNYTVDIYWKDSCLEKAYITPAFSGITKIKYPTICADTVKITDKNGAEVKFEKIAEDIISFEAESGNTYMLVGAPDFVRTASVQYIEASRLDGGKGLVVWIPSESAKYYVYRAFESEPCYTLIADGITALSYIDKERNGRQATYKVVSKAEGKFFDKGVCKTVPPDGVEIKEVKGFGMGPGEFVKNNW